MEDMNQHPLMCGLRAVLSRRLRTFDGPVPWRVTRREWVTVQHVMRETGVSRRTVHDWIRRGLLPARVLPSGRLRVQASAAWQCVSPAAGPWWSGRDALRLVLAASEPELLALAAAASPTLAAVAQWRVAQQRAAA